MPNTYWPTKGDSWKFPEQVLCYQTVVLDKAIHYSRPGKVNRATEETGCNHYSKGIFELSIKNLNGISYRTCDKGNFKASFSMRNILRRGQRLIVAILGGHHFFYLRDSYLKPTTGKTPAHLPHHCLDFWALKNRFCNLEQV